jgi:hypothetical protein
MGSTFPPDRPLRAAEVQPVRFRLVYDAGCPPCRTLSRLAVALSLGTIRRVAGEMPEAAALRARHSARRGELMLTDGARAWIGPAVFAAVPRAIFAALLRRPAPPQVP